MEENEYCKICFLTNKDKEDKLINPCNCKTYVHKECIEKWRRHKIGKIQYYRCEVCLQKYKISIFSNQLLAYSIRFIYFNLAFVNYSYYVLSTLLNLLFGYFLYSIKITLVNILSCLTSFIYLFVNGLFIVNMFCIFFTTVFGISIALTNRKHFYWKDTDNVDIRILYFINFINIAFSNFSILFLLLSIFTLKVTLHYIIEFCLRDVKEVLSENDFSLDNNLLEVMYCPEIKNHPNHYDEDHAYYHMLNSI